MGMFDDIIADNLFCKECDAELSGFQSKSGPKVLAKMPVHELFAYNYEPHFYTECTECGGWNEFTAKIKISRYYDPSLNS